MEKHLNGNIQQHIGKKTHGKSPPKYQELVLGKEIPPPPENDIRCLLPKRDYFKGKDRVPIITFERRAVSFLGGVHGLILN